MKKKIEKMSGSLIRLIIIICIAIVFIFLFISNKNDEEKFNETIESETNTEIKEITNPSEIEESLDNIMPNFKGKDLNEITRYLGQYYIVTDIIYEYHDDLYNGEIISHIPKEGDNIIENERATIIVNISDKKRGKDTIVNNISNENEIPDGYTIFESVLLLNVDDAYLQMVSKGFTVKTEPIIVENGDIGIVYACDIAEENKIIDTPYIKTGSEIILYYAGTQEMIDDYNSLKE